MDKESKIMILDRAAFNQGKNAQYEFQIIEGGVCPTLVAKGPCAVVAAFEGNGARPSHLGVGINDGQIMYTLNSTEVHGVVVKDEPRNNPAESDHRCTEP